MATISATAAASVACGPHALAPCGRLPRRHGCCPCFTVATRRCQPVGVAARPAAAAAQRRTPRPHPQPQPQQQRAQLVPCRAGPSDQQQQQQQPVPSTSSAGEGSAPAGVQYNTEFGYSRKDVLIIIVALIGAGVLMYEGLQAAGMDAGMAGNWVQLVIFLGICVGWVSTYLWRVANKKMTYAQQLQMYESAVMQKRLEEMTEAELQQLMSEVEADKARLGAAKAALLQKQQQSSQQGQ